MNKINVCFAADNNYAKYMGLTLMSILENADKDDVFHFFILDNGIRKKEKDKIATLQKIKPFEISYIPINEESFKNLYIHQRGLTLTAFARFLIPQLIHEDKIIYLDCDIFVRKSLTPLFNMDISNYYMAGVFDFAIKEKYIISRFKRERLLGNYLNSGVLLINNRRWKEDDVAKKLLDYANTHSAVLKYSDQDCLNYILHPHTMKVNPTWNMRNHCYDPYLFNKQPNKKEILEAQKDPAIRHFKPWLKNNICEFREEYIRMMERSPWQEFVPKDDLSLINFIKVMFKYWKRYPTCFLTPKFYIRIKYRGFKKTILGAIE